MKKKDKPGRLSLFESVPIPRAVLTLSVPTVCSSLVMVLYSLADTVFVGMINDPVQTAAVSLAAPVLLAFNAINNLFGVGASSMMSRALGARDFKTVRQSSAFGFYGALFCSILFGLFVRIFIGGLLGMLGAGADTMFSTERYLLWTVILGAPAAICNVVLAYLVRAEGKTLQASIGTMSGCLLNIVLDPLFILVFGMGAEGAALATMISNTWAVVYFLLYIFIERKSTCICLDFREFTLKKQIVFGVCAVGIPASIQNLLNVAGQMTANNLAAGYSTEAVAAMGIAMKAAMVPMYCAMGVSQGVMPLVGYTFAAGKIRRMKAAIHFCGKLMILSLLAMTAVYELFPTEIMHMFIENAMTVQIGDVLIRGLALAMPFLSMDFLAVGVFQAAGKGSLSLFMAIMRKVVLEIPFMFLFNRIWPLYGLGFSQFGAELLMCCIGLYLLRRFIRQCETRMSVAV